jgi:hypothetical protein
MFLAKFRMNFTSYKLLQNFDKITLKTTGFFLQKFAQFLLTNCGARIPQTRLCRNLLNFVSSNSRVDRSTLYDCLRTSQQKLSCPMQPRDSSAHSWVASQSIDPQRVATLQDMSHMHDNSLLW